MRLRLKPTIVAIAACSLVLAACSSGGSSGSSTAGSDGTTAASGSTAGTETSTPDSGTTAGTDTSTPDSGSTASTGGDTGDGVAAAQARVDEFRKPIESIADLGITEPVPVPADLQVFYVQCPVPVCEVIGQGLQVAVDAIGGELTIQTSDGTPEGTQAGWQAGVQAAPDLFVSSGNPVEWYEAELKQMNEAGIPVVEWSLPDGFQPEGIDANLITGGDYYFQGALIADYITAATNGDANVLLINIPGSFPVLDLEQQGFMTEFESVCEGCTVNVQEITINQLLAGEHISLAVSECQKDTEINYIFAGFGDLLIGMHEALADAGVCADVPSISQAGTPANYALIEQGSQAADVGLPSEFLAYRAIDVGLRAIAGQDVGRAPARPLTDLPAAADVKGASDILVAGIPLRLLEKDSVGDPATPWPGVEGFQDQFLKLWEVGS